MLHAGLRELLIWRRVFSPKEPSNFDQTRSVTYLELSSANFVKFIFQNHINLSTAAYPLCPFLPRRTALIMAPKIPAFDDLTLDPKGPPGNAWGLFGPGNELGMLNLVTPEVTREAAKEIKEGVRFSLDWGFDKPAHPSFGRPPFKHELINKAPRYVNDDMITFNTQCSSQWDGFRHYGNQNYKCFFNGHSLEELKTTGVIGIDSWLKVGGGIATRGVLLDYAEYAERKGISIDAFTSSDIPLSALEEIAKEIGVEFRSGDILFVRSGYVRAYEKLTAEEEPKICARETPDFIGVQSGEATCRWLWKNQFAAIAGDAPGFERTPIMGAHADQNYILHHWCLANWGMPLGEMFYLEELAAHCKKVGTWTFFVSSAPLKVSPAPNRSNGFVS